MKLFLTSAYEAHDGLTALKSFAAIDRVKRHELCSDPEKADAILFIENTQFDDIMFKHLLSHPLVTKYPHKVFMYNEMDRPWHVLPGLYCCMARRHFDVQQHVAFAYLGTPNPFISNIYKEDSERRWLFSFMGSMSHACRRPIIKLKRHNGYVQDTSDFNVWDSTQEELEVRGRAYADMLAASQFVLCPRGIGTSSIRLYETMQAGRVPVIISDHWVAPPETDWRFAIQVEERRISSIPGLLSSMTGEVEERGRAARSAWEQSYSPETMFNTAADSISALLFSKGKHSGSTNNSGLHKWLASGELLTRTAARRIRR